MSENQQKNDRMGEIIRFVITGGLCFAVEFVVLVLLKELLHLDILIATPIAFTVSVIVNYLLCMVWVFGGAKDGGNAAKVGFMVTSIIGLFLNEALMFLFRITLGEEAVLFTLPIVGFAVTVYMVNKAVATLLVMVWNYFTKRAVLKSDMIAKLTARLGK